MPKGIKVTTSRSARSSSLWTLAEAFLVFLTAFHHSAATEKLHLEIVDELNRPLPARVLVRDQAGNDHAPSGSIPVPLGKDHWFVSSGTSELDVPSGELNLRVERGLEFHPEKQTIVCKAGRPNRQIVKLSRWIDMRQLGYACGENHLHVPIDKLGPQLVAEGLDFGTSLQWWNARKLDVSTSGGPFRLLEFAGKRVPTSVFDYEVEHDWGAVYVLGQPTPLAKENEPDSLNLPLISKSHQAGALVCYQGGWSREVLLDALLGHVDVVNVCNNNFLRNAYQPRSRYSNLLRVPGFPTYANTAQEMLRMNTETYYRLLNCGLQLSAGAGSATGAKRTPVGYNRAYVRLAGDAGLKDFLQQWREGNNFVTNGPMLFLNVNDHYRPGDTIELPTQGETLEIEVTAHFPDQISNLEIVLNGQVVHHVSQPKSGVALRFPITVAKSSWLAARCTARDQLLTDAELADYSWGSPSMPRRPTRLRFAHTSPVYLSRNGGRVRIEKSIREADQMLDALGTFTQENSSLANRASILSLIEEARQSLQD